jgi:hypothetical protein
MTISPIPIKLCRVSLRLRGQDCCRRVLPASSGVQNGLAVTLAKGVVKGGGVVLGQVVTHDRLTTILVYTLQDLVSSSIAETGEEGEETSAGRSSGLVLEDDSVELGNACNLALVAHKALGDGVNGVEDGEFRDAGATCSMSMACSGCDSRHSMRTSSEYSSSRRLLLVFLGCSGQNFAALGGGILDGR